MKQSGFLTVATFALQSALKATLKDKDTLQEYIVWRALHVLLTTLCNRVLGRVRLASTVLKKTRKPCIVCTTNKNCHFNKY
jgi:hypothetical protein